jgi:hypothetical protein
MKSLIHPLLELMDMEYLWRLRDVDVALNRPTHGVTLMRRILRTLTTLVSVPFLGACFSTQPAPLPSPEARDDAEIRGVVVGDSLTRGQEIEFDEVYSVEWGQNDLSIQGLLADGADGQSPAGPVRRSYPYSDLSGVLTRRLDADRTSILVGATAITAISAIVYFFAERTGARNPTVTPGG